MTSNLRDSAAEHTEGLLPDLIKSAALVSLLAISACATPDYPITPQASAGAIAAPMASLPGSTAGGAVVTTAASAVASDSGALATTVPQGSVTTEPLPTLAMADASPQTLPEPAVETEAAKPAPKPEPVAVPAAPAVHTAPVKPAATPAKPPAPKMITVAKGPIVDVPGPQQIYTVKKADRLDAIARSLGTTREALATDNKLEAPFTLRPGQLLKGPATTRKAYVVQADDTLFAISQRFGTKPEIISELNGLKKGAAIRKGQKLLLPDGFKDKGPQKRPAPNQPVVAPVKPEPKPVPVKPAPVKPEPPKPSVPVQPGPSPVTPPKPVVKPPVMPPLTPPKPVVKPPVSPPSPTPVPDAALSVSDSQIASLGRGKFGWPVQGEVISTFGPKLGGQRNDGINIRGEEGSAVAAAAGGEVVYAGNQVPGFGNLVLIKHSDGWVTAYAHLQKINVTNRQQVQRADVIGLLGMTGVTSPQLHFEIRYAPSPKDKAKAIDPMLVLPR
jgi:murein DD-endopeptidase MepM/ murein hydrolase activator NlpD